MRFTLQVNAEEFWASLHKDIRLSKDSIFIQTLSFEGDPIGKTLSHHLLSSNSHDVRILVDSYTKFVINDKFRFSPKNLLNAGLRHEAKETFQMFKDIENGKVKVKFTNPVDPFLTQFLARNHKKLIVIDGKIVYIGGINFSEHNFAWHDMTLRIDDLDIAEFLRMDFLSTWNGYNLSTVRRFEGVEFHILDGHSNEVTFEPILRLIETAREKIYIESPYVALPFYDKLREVRRKGVAVTIIVPEVNNWGFMNNYSRWESARSDIELQLYKRMTHMKAMLIDDNFLIVGSSNFDYLSYKLHQEILAVITDGAVISNFKRVIIEDLKNSRKFEGAVTVSQGLLVKLGVTFLKTLVAYLKRR